MLMRSTAPSSWSEASQKPIVIGKGGAAIKAIGTAAREELERFFDASVFLDLHVKVQEDWREDERMLDEFGGRGREKAASNADSRVLHLLGLSWSRRAAVDVVLDSVKRLLRIGATANLLNLLQKQHPADLAQVFGELLEPSGQAVVHAARRTPAQARDGDHQRAGARSRRPAARPGARPRRSPSSSQELPSDDAAALIDYLPEELSREVLELMRPQGVGRRSRACSSTPSRPPAAS